MEVGLHEGSRNPEEEERGLKKASNEDVVMNLNCESPKAQNVCRICHLDSSEVVPLGCDCRGELGLSHHNCAEAWFSQKGNRLCEICGKTARNIVVNQDENALILMMEWNEMRLAAATLDGYDESSRARRRCKKYFCYIVLACLVLAFVLPWFFRGTNLL
ncbi:hypothetical protein ACS0TY_017316 [Phlomoides rotata]